MDRGVRRRERGSSPHTRGALPEGVPVADAPGIIPAYAGSTLGNWTETCIRPDHPRIRGEHGSLANSAGISCGSSPHTRGAPRHLHLRRQACRIIPAYAGSTSTCAQPRTPRKDHPRIRGEHDDSDQYVIDGLGSSPHTRGARAHVHELVEEHRIIPAYAGSTPRRPGRRPSDSDHPRIRGEHPFCHFHSAC